MFKRIFGCLIFFNIGVNTAFSQKLQFGFKVGADMHKIDGVSFNDQFTFGYHFGAFAEIGINSRWSIQPEIYFSQLSVDTGTHFSQVYTFNKIPKMKFGYINIPVMLNFKPNPFIAFELGPQFGIISKSNVSLVQNGEDAFKSGDIGVAAGLQLYISKIRLYGRYVFGISELNAIDDRDSWKNKTLHLGLGFRL